MKMAKYVDVELVLQKWLGKNGFFAYWLCLLSCIQKCVEITEENKIENVVCKLKLIVTVEFVWSVECQSS
jgi:hypothetical protein